MQNYFLQTIEHLRHYEEVLLYGSLLQIPEEQEKEVATYLAREYGQESLHYPFTAPAFDPAAAAWAAKTVYIATQLLLYRENKEADLQALLPGYPAALTPGAVLSADLVLRFLPHAIHHLKAIDPEDGLVDVLETHLTSWHYSGIGYTLPHERLDFSVITAHPCLLQLYTDRVIEKKEQQLALHPALVQHIQASMGLHTQVYWSNFQPQLENGNN
jgi:hypothetical protein